MKVIVVGAGVAGLTCARLLQTAGADVVVLEASDGVGGRVRSDKVEGFTLDRGFQVLFTAYPTAQKFLDYARLDLQKFDPGALICRAAKQFVLSDPIRDPSALAASVLSPVVTPADKARTALLSVQLLAKSVQAIMDEPGDETTLAFLQRHGFSSAFIENFVRPFFSGVFLEDKLETSAKTFQFDWKMLTSGDTVVPAKGMGQISEQLAEPLFAADKILLNAPVQELVRTSDTFRCVGVRFANGETLKADCVVLATPAPEAARLLGHNAPPKLPKGKNGTTTVYFTSDHAPVFPGKKVALHANINPFVGNAVQIEQVAPNYAPPGKHLLSAAILGIPNGDDEAIARRALSDLRRMVAGDKIALRALDTYRPLRVYRIPYGQFPQPPGVYDALPENADSGLLGVVLAGEYTAASSFNAAMRSGEKAADLILQNH